jgi:hypothetical protein
MNIDSPQHMRATEQQLLESHVRARVAPAGLAHLAYELAVPKAWASAAEFGPTPSGPLATRGIGFFASANLDGAPTIALTATPVPYEVPIDAWARWLFACEGWTTLQSVWFPGPAGSFYDIAATCIRDDLEYVRRSAVWVVGSDIIMVNCQCALDHWVHAKDDFWTALITFEPAAKGATRMEPWVRVRAGEPGFELAHPASWLHEPVEPHDAGVSAIDLKLPDADGGELSAYLQVRARRLSGAPLQPLAALDARTWARLEASGVTAVGSSTQLTTDDDPRSIAIDGWLGGFHGHARMLGTTIEALRGYVVRGDTVFTLLALSPLLQANPLASLRARRVWEIARASLADSIPGR